MTKIQTDGIVAFHVDLRVYPDQIKNWSPERIAKFFDGIAQAIEAGNIDAKVEMSKDGTFPFRPYVYRSQAGNRWTVIFDGERDYTESRKIEVVAHVGIDSENIVGITLYDENMKATTPRKPTP
jgi:hypothetical protein